MLEKIDIYKLLLEKIEGLEKFSIRIMIIKFIIPFLYFLIIFDNKIFVNIPYVNISDNKLIIIYTPLIYSIVLFISRLSSVRYELIQKKIKEMDESSDQQIKHLMKSEIYPENWKNLLFPISFINESSKTLIDSGVLGKVIIIFFAPAIISIMIFPTLFLIYCIYNNFKTVSSFTEPAALVGYIAIFTLIGLLLQFFLKIKR